jgi:hypothetical protein
MEEVLQKHIFHGTIYAHNSGGSPEHIPDITFEKLKDFHKNHYHPSQAKIYTYGNLPFARHLQYVLDFSFLTFKILE